MVGLMRKRVPDKEDGMKHTDKIRVLSPGVVIAYSSARGADYPPQAVRDDILNAAEQARTIMRAAVRKLDKVVFFRRPEGEPFTSIVNYHFGLDAARGHTLDNNMVDAPASLRSLRNNDRRTVLNKIRMGMLSVSFHLNTGVYLIDIDAANRTIHVGNQTNAVDPQNVTTHGYVGNPKEKSVNLFGQKFTILDQGVGMQQGLFSGIRNGEIHINFDKMHTGGYTHQTSARVIIHEAFHKYWGVTDHLYGWQGGYDNLSIDNLLDNADSYAWAALSIEAGHLIKGISSRDGANAGVHA
jgi:hypothetical protein